MSKAVELFNGLNGTVATREQLKEIADLSLQEEQSHIYARIQNVLSNNEDELFDINIEDNAFEILPKSMLNGIDFDSLNEIENNGLNKAVSPNEIYQSITDLIINTIKEVGYLPWQKEWKGTGLPTARNYVTGNPYTGINAMTLPYEEKEINGKLVIVEPKYTDIYYLTFNQIEKLGATLKKGSKGRIVTYFNFIFNYENKEKGLKLTTSNASDIATFVKKNKLRQEEVEVNLTRYPVLKYYRVFKATDCENLPAKEPKKVNATPNEIAEKIIELYPNSPKIIIGKDERAFYSPGFDEVNMPKVNAFNEESFYYSTFFHELIHSTGHPKRLDRNMSGFKGDSDYAFEELIAELGAVYLCAESGILFRTIENSAKYLRGWHKRLLGKLEEDNKFFFKAAASAQKGSNYILNLDEQGEPAYRKYFEKQEVKPVSKVQKKTKKPVEKPIKETKKVVKSVVKPVAKVQKKTNRKSFDDLVSDEKSNTLEKIRERKANRIVGYLLLDSISGDVVATKKTLQELELVYNNLKQNEIGKDLEVFVYEIVNKAGKNQKGKRILVDWKKPVEKPIEQPVKVDSNGQTSLFGVKKVTPKSAPKKHAKIQKIALAGNDQESEFFTVAGEVGKFLQQVERKPVESVVITMDGQQGAGKTTTLYKFMDSFAVTGNKCLFLSLEEHPASSLAKDKVSKYLSAEAQENIDTVGEVENVAELYEFIKDYEIIFIDSWQKLQRMVGAIRLDEDLRKKFNGKVFVVIFQQTTTGRTKGGAEVVFDGDIIIKMVKESSFTDNYAYFDKNRYTLVPIEDIRFNIASGTCYNPNSKEETQEPATELQPVENVEFSFVIK
ncbi:zincin-like metallopeptidase domain-containing protein [Flavobacterium sp.]|uniref:zincin-like metallopeptidase domain-containing protein n=2 Tax=Flavobacterium sp. TaxID=239 RepID=UPI004048B5F5